MSVGCSSSCIQGGDHYASSFPLLCPLGSNKQNCDSDPLPRNSMSPSGRTIIGIHVKYSGFLSGIHLLGWQRGVEESLPINDQDGASRFRPCSLTGEIRPTSARVGYRILRWPFTARGASIMDTKTGGREFLQLPPKSGSEGPKGPLRCRQILLRDIPFFLGLLNSSTSRCRLFLEAFGKLNTSTYN